MKKKVNILVEYAVKNGLIEERDRVWALNRVASALNLKEGVDFEPVKTKLPAYPADLLFSLTQDPFLQDRIMGIFTARPSEFAAVFSLRAHERGIKAATDWLYNLNQKNYYIKTERVAKNISWKTKTKFGNLELTINMSKPELTPQEIAYFAKHSRDGVYPKCALCKENEGYAPVQRQNLRLLPVELQNKIWFFQYSPYVYYPQHSIIFSAEHTPMQITPATFERFADFLEFFPHFFIGSNADIPTVGGSILSHDHYQGGAYTFALEKAAPARKFKIKNVSCEILDWPLTVLRLRGKRKDVTRAAADVLKKWLRFNDKAAGIFAAEGGKRKSALTPIARVKKGQMEIDLVLRNTAFNTKPERQNIKRENIGIIEVLGLAVLPARLEAEFKALAQHLISNTLEKIKADKNLEKHYNWAKKIAAKHKFTAKNAAQALQTEAGHTFAEILKDCNVFQPTKEGQAALEKFLKSLK